MGSLSDLSFSELEEKLENLRDLCELEAARDPMDTNVLMDGIFTDLTTTKKKNSKIKPKSLYATKINELSASNIELVANNPYEGQPKQN